MSDTHEPEKASLEAQLQSLETLRPVLGDATVDAVRREIEGRLAALGQTDGGRTTLRDVHTGGGDFVARDLIKVQVAADAPPDGLLSAYYRDLAAECSRLPLGVVDPRFAQPGASTQLCLPSVYTDLHVVSVPRDEDENERRYGLRLARAAEGERLPLLDVVGGERGARLVLVGDAGSGKSTFVGYLSYRLADALAKGDTADVPEGLRGLLPVRLVLRQTAALIGANDAGGGGDLLWRAIEQDICRRLGEQAAKRLFPVLQQRLLDPKQGGLVLLDGLDEVPESGARRELLLAAVRRLSDGLPARSRVLLTARPYAYADPKWHLPGFAELALAPFDPDQVANFIAHWYRAVRPVMGWDDATAEQRGHALRHAIEERAYLGDLTRTPMTTSARPMSWSCRPSASPGIRSPTPNSAPSGRRGATRTSAGGPRRAGPGARGPRRTCRRSRTRSSGSDMRNGSARGRGTVAIGPSGGTSTRGTGPTGRWSASLGTRPWPIAAGSNPKFRHRSQAPGSCCPARPSGRRPPAAAMPAAGPGATSGARTTPIRKRPAC